MGFWLEHDKNSIKIDKIGLEYCIFFSFTMLVYDISVDLRNNFGRGIDGTSEGLVQQLLRTGGCGQIPPFEDRTHLHCSREASSTFRRHGWKSLLNLLSEAFHEKAGHNRSRYCWCHRRERSELHRAASTPHAGHPDGHHENEGFGAVRGAILILFEVIHEGLPGGHRTVAKILILGVGITGFLVKLT